MSPDLTHATWRKSSRSAGNGGQCVELANIGAVRDSKNPSGPTLSVDLAGMLAAVKQGRFTR
jgi:hypothetical protein